MTQLQLRRDIYPPGPVPGPLFSANSPLFSSLPSVPGPGWTFSLLSTTVSSRADDPCPPRRPPSTFLCAEPPRRAGGETLTTRRWNTRGLIQITGATVLPGRAPRSLSLFLSRAVSLPSAFLPLSRLPDPFLFSNARHSPPSYWQPIISLIYRIPSPFSNPSLSLGLSLFCAHLRALTVFSFQHPFILVRSFLVRMCA